MAHLLLISLKPELAREITPPLMASEKLFKQGLKEAGIELEQGQNTHVHLIVNPQTEDSLAKAIGETHRLYTKMVNTRECWSGYLWQGRFASFPMDESYLLRAVAYVELNPVAAGMVKSAKDYPYSSVHAHLSGKDELGIINPNHLLDLVDDWETYLRLSQSDKVDELQKHARTGRPLGDSGFIQKAENMLGRVLVKGKPGPKRVDDQ